VLDRVGRVKGFARHDFASSRIALRLFAITFRILGPREVLLKIAVLTSGGDAPGMNAAVRAITRGALAKGWEVFGVRNGYAGLLANTIARLQARDVGGIIQQGGTVLGSARSAEFAQPEGRATALRNLASHGIEAMVVVGGNGSQTGSYSLSKEGFAVVGVPSTIDNDVYGNDVTIGCDTAINVTLEAIDRLRTTASSHQRAFAVETMGRNCGYIALMAGIAGGAEVIALPESELKPSEVAERLRAAYQRGKTHALVVIAEGAKCGVHELMGYYRAHRKSIGFDLRVTRLGHVVRGGIPSAADRVLATRLGAAAVEALAAGRQGVLVGIIKGDAVVTPLAEIAGKMRPADADLLELARVMAL
jgi:6-phosphofructokinase 1